MLSRKTSKYVKSLQLKKYRKQHGAFLAEGAKIVLEVLQSAYPVELLIATEEFVSEHPEVQALGDRLQVIPAEELRQTGSLQQNNAAIAVLPIPVHGRPDLEAPGWTLVLDAINDPGNLGTILRIADWYGVKQVICSPDTVDVYNAKTIAASMGSFLRMPTYYMDIPDLLTSYEGPVCGAVLEGTSVHGMAFAERGILMIGSESHGIREEWLDMLTQKVTIPRFGEAESLNAGVATAVILDNITRAQS